MTELTAMEAAAHIAVPIRDAGGKWMLHPETLGPCKDAGYPNGFVYYGLGRGGVLGDVDADVVTAAFGFFAPELVRGIWESGVGVEGPRNSARRYGQACAAFGRARLGDWAGARRFGDLAAKVVAAAPLPGMSLFAAWKHEPVPVDDAGRAYFYTHILREWRGSAHVVAVASSGLSAHEAIVAGPGNEEQAKFFGWTEPLGDVSHLAGKRNAAEQHTDELCAATLDKALTATERGELATLVDELFAAIV